MIKRQLLEDDKSVGEIAFMLGYHEPAYLSKVFKKYEGITMQEYRREHRENSWKNHI